MDARDPEQIEELAKALRVLGHATRLAVLEMLGGDEMPVGELAERMELGMSMLSQQLAVLREAGLVNTRREGKQVYYSVNGEQLAALASAIGALGPDDLHQPIGSGPFSDPRVTRMGAAMFAQIRSPKR